MFIHITDALEEGNNVFLIHTVDTDIVVICIGKFHAILARYPDFQLWVKFGTGSTQHMFSGEGEQFTPGRQNPI